MWRRATLIFKDLKVLSVALAHRSWRFMVHDYDISFAQRGEPCAMNGLPMDLLDTWECGVHGQPSKR
jgi:hypothetical protein